MYRSIYDEITALRVIVNGFPKRGMMERSFTLTGRNGKGIFDFIDAERAELQRRLAVLEAATADDNVVFFPAK